MKPKEPLTPEQRKDLQTRFRAWWWPNEVDEIIEEALNHRAAARCVSEYLYLRNWLRRDSQRLRPTHPDEVPRTRPGTNYDSWLRR